MLVWGTANPEGLGDSYNGLFFRAADIRQSVDEIVGKPVKIEHKGADVGRVVSAWTDRSGKLDLLLEINTRDVEGALIASLVNDGICRDLSLGYTVTMTHSDKGENIAGRKRVHEVSLVRRGARHDCHIHAFTPFGVRKKAMKRS